MSIMICGHTFFLSPLFGVCTVFNVTDSYQSPIIVMDMLGYGYITLQLISPASFDG